MVVVWTLFDFGPINYMFSVRIRYWSLCEKGGRRGWECEGGESKIQIFLRIVFGLTWTLEDFYFIFRPLSRFDGLCSRFFLFFFPFLLPLLLALGVGHQS